VEAGEFNRPNVYSRLTQVPMMKKPDFSWLRDKIRKTKLIPIEINNTDSYLNLA
jgi:hypothetical protein